MLLNHKKKAIFYDIILLFIFLSMIIDYLLSYWGINILYYIEEYNPIMVSFMMLPFWQGIIIRIIYSFSVLFVIRMLKNKLTNKITYTGVLSVLVLIQVIPYTAHAIWLFRYFK